LNIDLDSESLTLTGGTGVVTVGSGNTMTFNSVDSEIVHDSLSGFVANEHIDHTAVTLTAGVGLSGGGTIAANRTFTVDLNELTTETTIADADFIAMVDATDDGSGKITFENLEDAVFASVSGDVTITEGGVAQIADNAVDLTTHSTGNYVATITGGTGIDSSAATSGEGTTHSLSVDLNELTTETTIADADFIAMVDATDDASGKITFENLEDAIFASVSGDVLITEAGVSSIQANSVALATDTVGDYVQNITAGTGLTSTGATSGENIAHSLSVDANQTQIVQTGTLAVGAISSGFGAIDIGSSAANFGATTVDSLSASDGNITNVGDIALDSISADGTDINIAVTDNSATALTVKQGSDAYLIIDTANSSESVAIGTGISGTAVSIGHGTSETIVNDNLTVTGDLTVSGTTTTVSSGTLTIGDTLIKLGQAYTGSAYDQGIVFTRGDGSSTNTQNMAFIWDESADSFATIKAATEAGTTSGNVTVTDYVPLRVGALTADDASTFTSTISAATGSTIGNLTLANGSITDSSGAISFGNENLSTSGTLGAGVVTATGLTIGSAVITEAELEILDGASLTTTELNYVDGVTSAIQTQIDTKSPIASPTFTGTITIGSAAIAEAELEMIDGITAGTAAASKAVVLDGSKNIATLGTIGSGAITATGSSSFATSIKTPLIEYTNGDDAITIASGGGITAAAGITSTAASNSLGATVFSGAVTTNSTIDGIDIATRDAILTSTTTTAGAALPKAGGTMTGNIVMGDDTSIGIADDAERIEFDGAGDISVLGANFGIGISAPERLLHLQDDNEANLAIETNNNGASNFAGLRRYKSRGTKASPTVVADDDTLAFDAVYGYDGNSYATGASIGYKVDGTPGDGDMPTRIELSTSANGSQSPTTRMTILSDGNIGIGTDVPGSLLTVKGDNQAIDLRSNDFSNVLISSAGSSGAGLDRGSIILRENGSNKILLGGNGNADFSGRISLGTQTNAINSFTQNYGRWGGHSLDLADMLYNAYWTGSAWINDADDKDSYLLRLHHNTGLTFEVSTAKATPSFVTKFSVTNAGDGTFGGRAYVTAGSAAYAAYSFSGDSDSGMYSEGANSIGFAVAGVKVATMNDNTFTVFGAQSDNAVIKMYADAGDNDNDKYRILAEDGGGGLKFQTEESGSWVSMVEFHADGNVFIGDNANGNMTKGLTISQGANDDEILALKSSDVAHGMTDDTETDTFGLFKKAQADSGGLEIKGYKDNADSPAFALALKGRLGEAADTAKTTSGNGVVVIEGAVQNSAGITDVGSDGNILTIRNNTTTRFIFDAEGSAHADVEWIAFSDSRLKENQLPSPYGLADVLQLQPKVYDRKSGYIDEGGNTVLEDNSRHMVGFIAQEVMAVIPEAVKPVDEKLSFYSLNTDPIIAALVGAVQELSAKVEALENA